MGQGGEVRVGQGGINGWKIKNAIGMRGRRGGAKGRSWGWNKWEEFVVDQGEELGWSKGEWLKGEEFGVEQGESEVEQRGRVGVEQMGGVGVDQGGELGQQRGGVGVEPGGGVEQREGWVELHLGTGPANL